ncbi:hypothetical protein D1AOALGA4SA_2728 [Olavius algarvensis Delta 1 endosymbiont]|nr:hypothetical protein D1AOALGA4SA_2728 [Olavius algarvensis Delta 1 endosymbiont]
MSSTENGWNILAKRGPCGAATAQIKEFRCRVSGVSCQLSVVRTATH